MRPLWVLRGVERLEDGGEAVEGILDRMETRLRHRHYRRIKRIPGGIRFHAKALDRQTTIRPFPAEMRLGRAELSLEHDGEGVLARWRWDATTVIVLCAVGMVLFLAFGLMVSRHVESGIVPFVFLFPPALLFVGNILAGRSGLKRLIRVLADPSPRGGADERG